MSKHASDLQLLSALLTTTYSLLDWFCSLLAALLSRYPMTHPGFSFTASCNGLSVLPWGDTSHTYLSPMALLRYGRKSYNAFLVSLILKSEPCGWNCQVLLLDGDGTCPPCSNTFSLTFWFWWFSSLCRLFLCSYVSQVESFGGWRLALRSPLSLFQSAPGFSLNFSSPWALT